MSQHTHLLIIDPQNDFCDLPAPYCPMDASTGRPWSPALPVAGAHADMQRLAGLIRAGGAAIDEISVTLDSHHQLDIAHPGFWQQRTNSTATGWAAVAPFTPITAAQLAAGDFAPRDPANLPRAITYLAELEARGRYTLMVWPVHCEIGSWGHNVHADVRAAYNGWEAQRQRSVDKITKGENTWTEHYSAILAEVPDADDPHTLLNHRLLTRLDRADRILIAGEASSHCVRATTEHIVAHLSGLPNGRPERITLLTDAMSPVGGFEAQHDVFLADMRLRGLGLFTTAQVLAQLQN